MPSLTWTCAHGHSFVFGDEEWHYELNQGLLEDGAPIPMYCTEQFDYTDEDAGIYEDEPCLDSSSLIYS